uniref:Cytochrome P450 oxidase CYP76A54 n=1 Tax=Polygala tenuifolia TaxID=355332 RepID=A0A3G5ANN0_9FABA|nr:cytochrome P450 oxidase CYP76A54 [Polygala tenuifolia]
MDSIAYSVAFFSAVFFFLLLHKKSAFKRRLLPPGPSGWPIFGNMFQLGDMPHRTLYHLKDQYGPVIWLRIGLINTMAILTAKAATEFFKDHDLDFADRTIRNNMRVHDYSNGSLALAPYGSFWRVMRRLVTVEMISARSINETAFIRRRCMDDLLAWIDKEARTEQNAKNAIHVSHFVFMMTFNVLGNLMLSRNLFDPDSDEGSEFYTAMNGLMESTGHRNIVDVFPWLAWLDPQGLRRKMERDMGKALEIASGFVKERMKEGYGDQVEGDKRKDFLNVLLEFRGNRNEEILEISEKEINIFILEIFMAGGETTSSTIEWALTELLCNPQVMGKAKAELAQVVGSKRNVEESDIENLPYLQAVIKETMRLHPPIPLLVPRRAIQDTQFMGYDIPKDTQVFVNAWAIGRDPDVWEDPISYKPERFLGSKIDYKGQHCELIPFGAGRRMCAGVPLAHRSLNFILGSVLHRFDWELDPAVTPETLDRDDVLGVTMRKRVPLLAVPKLI